MAAKNHGIGILEVQLRLATALSLLGRGHRGFKRKLRARHADVQPLVADHPLVLARSSVGRCMLMAGIDLRISLGPNPQVHARLIRKLRITVECVAQQLTEALTDEALDLKFWFACLRRGQGALVGAGEARSFLDNALSATQWGLLLAGPAPGATGEGLGALRLHVDRVATFLTVCRDPGSTAIVGEIDQICTQWPTRPFEEMFPNASLPSLLRRGPSLELTARLCDSLGGNPASARCRLRGLMTELKRAIDAPMGDTAGAAAHRRNQQWQFAYIELAAAQLETESAARLGPDLARFAEHALGRPIYLALWSDATVAATAEQFQLSVEALQAEIDRIVEIVFGFRHAAPQLCAALDRWVTPPPSYD